MRLIFGDGRLSDMISSIESKEIRNICLEMKGAFLKSIGVDVNCIYNSCRGRWIQMLLKDLK